KVATNSLKIGSGPLRACCDSEIKLSLNIKCAIRVPKTPPVSWAVAYANAARYGNPCSSASANETTGLKCAPETASNANIRATRAAPVAMVFASSASAAFPPDSRSAIIPEPTTAATRNPVPTNSATTRRDKLAFIVRRSVQLLFAVPCDQVNSGPMRETNRFCDRESCKPHEMRIQFLAETPAPPADREPPYAPASLS